MPKLLTAALRYFFFDGIQVGQGQTVQVSAADLTRISKGKAFKSLVEKGELEVQEIPDEEPKAGGKTGGVVVKVVNKTMQQVSSKSQLMKMLYRREG